MITIIRTHLSAACFDSVLLSFHGSIFLLLSGLLCVEGGEEVFVDDFEMGNKTLDGDNDHLQQEPSFHITESLRQSDVYN